jgi:hypothetical protein
MNEEPKTIANVKISSMRKLGVSFPMIIDDERFPAAFLNINIYPPSFALYYRDFGKSAKS